MPYTNAELLAAIRTDHPEFKDVQDGPLLAAVAKDHPELLPAGAPEYKAETARLAAAGKDPLTPDSNTPMNALKGVGRGMANFASMGADALKGGNGLPGLSAGIAAAQQVGKGAAAQTGSEKFGHYAAAVVPMVGPWAAGLGERAGSGDIAGAAAELGTTLALPKVVSAVGAKVSAADPTVMLAKAKALRESAPSIGSTLNKVDLTRPGTILTGLNDLSKPVRAVAYEGAANYVDSQHAPAQGNTDAPMYSDYLGRWSQAQEPAPIQGPPVRPSVAQLPDSQPVGAEYPQVPQIAQDQLAAGRAAETPEQAYARQQQARDQVVPERLPPQPEAPQAGTPPTTPNFVQQQLAQGRQAPLDAEAEYQRQRAMQDDQASNNSRVPYGSTETLGAQPRSPELQRQMALQEGPDLGRVKELRDFAYGSDPAVQNVEQGIAPSSKEAQASTLRIAPRLAEDPQLATAKGLLFQQNLFTKFKNAEAGVSAAQANVPPGTTVPGTPIADGLAAIIEKYNSVGQTDAANLVAKEWNRWTNLLKDGDQIDYHADFAPNKRALGNDMRTAGKFRETGNPTDAAKATALREAYGVLMEAEKNVSPDLKKANVEYSTTIQGLDNAGMDIKTGRRYKDVPIAH